MDPVLLKLFCVHLKNCNKVMIVLLKSIIVNYKSKINTYLAATLLALVSGLFIREFNLSTSFYKICLIKIQQLYVIYMSLLIPIHLVVHLTL